MDGKSIEYGSNKLHRKSRMENSMLFNTWKQSHSNLLNHKIVTDRNLLILSTKSHSNVLSPMHKLKDMAPTPQKVCQNEVIRKRVKEKKVKEKEDLHPPQVASPQL